MNNWYFLSDVLAVRPGLSGRFNWITWISGRVAEEGSAAYPSNASPFIKGKPRHYERPFSDVAEDLQTHWMPEFWAKYTPKHYTMQSDGSSREIVDPHKRLNALRHADNYDVLVSGMDEQSYFIFFMCCNLDIADKYPELRDTAIAQIAAKRKKLFGVETEIARLSDGAIAPKFMAIALRETDNWNEEAPDYARAIAIAAGEIYGTFFYNARSVTHLCSPVPTYELYRVDTLGNVRSHSDSHDGRYDVSVEDREWLNEWFTQANHEPILYTDCGVIDRIPLEPGHHQLIEDLATRPLEELQELDTEGAIGEMTEYQSGNPTIC